jgi:hypothetical protein
MRKYKVLLGEWKRLAIKTLHGHTRVRGVLTAVIWKDKWDVCILTNLHKPPTEGNFCDEHGRANTPVIVEDYSWQVDYTDKGDRMANSYSVGWRTWYWTKNLLFHLLDLTVLNSCTVVTSCGSQVDHRTFLLTSDQNLFEVSARKPHPQSSWSQLNESSWNSTYWTLANCGIALVGAMCVQWRRKEWLQNFCAQSAKLACV